MEGFKALLLRAKSGDINAKQKMIDMYKGLLIKESCPDGYLDQDLNQQLYITFLNCVRSFQHDDYRKVLKK